MLINCSFVKCNEWNEIKEILSIDVKTSFGSKRNYIDLKGFKALHILNGYFPICRVCIGQVLLKHLSMLQKTKLQHI